MFPEDGQKQQNYKRDHADVLAVSSTSMDQQQQTPDRHTWCADVAALSVDGWQPNEDAVMMRSLGQHSTGGTCILVSKVHVHRWLLASDRQWHKEGHNTPLFGRDQERMKSVGYFRRMLVSALEFSSVCRHCWLIDRKKSGWFSFRTSEKRKPSPQLANPVSFGKWPLKRCASVFFTYVCIVNAPPKKTTDRCGLLLLAE